MNISNKPYSIFFTTSIKNDKTEKIDPKKTNFKNSIKVSFYYISDDNHFTI